MWFTLWYSEERFFNCFHLYSRIGRYPVHFHLNGDMSESYVKSCAIHQTFNRAINIHNSHNILIQNNVIYDVMGGALFLEDSIETGINIYRTIWTLISKLNKLPLSYCQWMLPLWTQFFTLLENNLYSFLRASKVDYPRLCDLIILYY